MSSEHIREELHKLADEALTEISGLRQPVIQFCGPISTGGFGDIKENIANLESYISFFEKKKEISIFNQLKYEQKMDAILRDHTDYDYPLLDFFYKEIFYSGKISGLVFLPLWETSIGCSWEFDCAKKLNIATLEVESNLADEVTLFYANLFKK